MVLVALFVGLLSLVLTPSDESRVATALSTRRPIVMHGVEQYVERHEVTQIVNAIEVGKNFVVIEGGNRMGKTIATKAAVAKLSRNRTFLWYNCTKESTMKIALQKLYGLERTKFVDVIFGFVQKSLCCSQC